MTLSSGLRRLATVVDELERADIAVRDASIDPGADGDGRIRATVELSVPVDQPAGTTATLDGTLDDSPLAVPDPDGASDGGERSETNGSDGGVGAGLRVTTGEPTTDEVATDDETVDAPTFECPEAGCDETFASEPGMKVHRTKVHLSGHTDGDGLPAYRDPARLATVYEAEDTFPEMRDALGADVSAQTVRRHMIRLGIHDPDVDAPDEEAESSATVAGFGENVRLAELLPDGVRVDEGLELADLRACVEGADTLYDVQQAFDLDRETARDLLTRFDLLELVHGRVATKHERDELKAEIDRRIQATLTDPPSA